MRSAQHLLTRPKPATIPPRVVASLIVYGD